MVVKVSYMKALLDFWICVARYVVDYIFITRVVFSHPEIPINYLLKCIVYLYWHGTHARMTYMVVAMCGRVL